MEWALFLLSEMERQQVWRDLGAILCGSFQCILHVVSIKEDTKMPLCKAIARQCKFAQMKD